MATTYTFSYSDTTKGSFIVQPYTANGSLSPSDITVIPQATVATTTLKLYGKGMQEYGEGIEQNLVYLLENFAAPTRPVFSIEGQIWYNNSGIGSPSSPELFVRNSNPDDTAGGIGWDAIILSTGSSPMKSELILAGNPVNNLGATPKQYVDGILTSHIGDDVVHISTIQNTFLDALSLPTLTALEVDQLIGINTSNTVQAQLDDKISRQGDAMDNGANLTFSIGGEVLGLPATPSVNDAAASKLYVDSQLAGGGGGDGVLTEVNWLTGSGNPVDPNQDAIQFIIYQLGVPSATILADGISRPGHLHIASDVSYDNTSNPSYPTDIQSVIEHIEVSKADLAGAAFTGDVSINGNFSANAAIFNGNVTAADPTSDSHVATKNYVDISIGSGSGSGNNIITRTFEAISADIITPTAYPAQEHTAGDNKLSISINGMKQYNASNGVNDILYDESITILTNTGLDESLIYDFNISVDGAPPTTITIPAAAGGINTHDVLIITINDLLSIAGVSATFALNGDVSTIERFTSLSTGNISNVTISDPAAGNQYLFEVGSLGTAILNANFLSEPPTTGSPANTPDDIIISGDVTASFPVGFVFKITGSLDATYGSFDGSYSVHVNGAVFDSTNTLIPIASVNDSSQNVPLLPTYTIGDSLPAPSSYGNILVQPIEGLIQVLSPVNGINGDYFETDNTGTAVLLGAETDSVVFNVTIPSGSLIETLLLG